MPHRDFDDETFFNAISAREARGDEPSKAAIERARRLADQPLSPEEYRARASVPIGEAEREEALALIRWFRKRYPTAADRLAYARRAYARWTAATNR